MEQRSVRIGVDHSHIFRAQPVDGAGHQLRNGQLSFFGEVAAAGFEDDGGLGIVLLLGEQRFLRHDQVHAHGFDFAQSGERAFEFAFEGALVVHFFGEVGPRPVGGVEQFKTHACAARQAGGGGFETAGVEFVFGDEQAGAVGRDLVGNILGGEMASQALRFFRAQAGVQGDILRLSQQRDEDPKGRAHQQRAASQQHTLVQGQPLKELLQALGDVVARCWGW
jgi:hypothetical protein